MHDRVRIAKAPIMNVQERVERALSSADEEALAECSYDIESYHLALGAFADDAFDVLMDAFKNPRFLAMTNGWRLLTVLQSDSDKLSDQQRRTLLSVIAHAFASITDRMTIFFVTELIEIPMDEQQTLDVILHWLKNCPESHLVFVPHAFEHLVARTTNMPLREVGFDHLRALRHNHSSEVRREVEESLSRLSRAENADVRSRASAELRSST